MNRAITGALAAAALTLAIAVPALAAPPYVLVDIVVICDSDGVPEDRSDTVVGEIPDAPPDQARRAIAEWFRTNDCDPGTRDLSFETRPITFQAFCEGLSGSTYTGATEPGLAESCEFDASSSNAFKRALAGLASLCRGKIAWIADSPFGASKVFCSGQ